MPCAYLRRELKAGRKSEPHAIDDGRPSAPPATKAPEPVAATSAGAPPSPPVIEVHDLSFTYRDGTAALREVSLTVPRGQFLVAGRPERLRQDHPCQALQRPTETRPRAACVVDGHDTRALRVPQLARIVGYVFQNPDHQIFAPTVRGGDRVRAAAAGSGARRKLNGGWLQSLANHELTACAGLPPATLSLGQRRQVTLAVRPCDPAGRPRARRTDRRAGLAQPGRADGRVDAFNGAGARSS